MNDDQPQMNVSGRPAVVRRIFVEALVLTVIGVVFALAANQISPRGLSLTRNYFPGGTSPVTLPVVTTNNPGTNSPAPTPEQLVIAQIKAKGLQTADGSLALQLFQDPRRQQDVVVFVDARDDSHYREGHIPGAYQLDPYHPEKYFEATLPVCQKADQIVVYCNGGECDDSESSALLLRDIGIPNQKLFVYTGGITEWAKNGQSIETGERNSGTLKPGGK